MSHGPLARYHDDKAGCGEQEKADQWRRSKKIPSSSISDMR